MLHNIDTPEQMKSVVIIACGALAKEIVALKALNAWDHVRIQCLPADLHNRPQLIPAAVAETIATIRATDPNVEIFAAYADCGTGGLLDQVLEREGVERLPGAHCYEFFATTAVFTELSEQVLGTFYLTDFLARHFERLIWQGLGLEKKPELLPLYFGNYERVLYLSQTHDPDLQVRAKQAADRLGLAFEALHTGYGDLQSELSVAIPSRVAA